MGLKGIQIALFLVALATGLTARDISYESSYENVALAEGNSFESSEEDSLPLAMAYDPGTDGPDVEAWWKKIHDEAGGAKYPESFRQAAYKKLKDSMLPEPTKRDLAKLDMELNNGEIKRTNQLRALHGAKPLEFDPKVAVYAQKYADTLSAQLAQGYPFQHNPDLNNRGLGENYAGDSDPHAQGDSTDMWYFREIGQYIENGNRPSPDYWPEDKATGHFTQTVWAGTKKMGCGRACSGATNCHVICNYYPGGNMDGSNVGMDFYPPNVNMKMNKSQRKAFNSYKKSVSSLAMGKVQVPDM